MEDGSRAASRPRIRWHHAIAALLAAVLVLVGVEVPAAASTTIGGVRLSIDYGGQTYDDTSAVVPGTNYTARVQYSVPELTPGGSVTVGVPDGVTITELTLVVPSGNTIVESLALNGAGDLVITFKDPLDKSINQGVIAFQFALSRRRAAPATATSRGRSRVSRLPAAADLHRARASGPARRPACGVAGRGGHGRRERRLVRRRAAERRNDRRPGALPHGDHRRLDRRRPEPRARARLRQDLEPERADAHRARRPGGARRAPRRHLHAEGRPAGVRGLRRSAATPRRPTRSRRRHGSPASTG